jgi:hypothetical protein
MVVYASGPAHFHHLLGYPYYGKSNTKVSGSSFAKLCAIVTLIIYGICGETLCKCLSSRRDLLLNDF